MPQFFSQYQGGGPAALPPGFMQAATSPGRSIAAGLESFGAGIAEGIERYHKNKSERLSADADFENALGRMLSLYGDEPVFSAVDNKVLERIQEGAASKEEILSATNSLNTLDKSLQAQQAQELRERQVKTAEETAALRQEESVLQQAEKQRQREQDKAFVETLKDLSGVPESRSETFLEWGPTGELRGLPLTQEEQRGKALEIFMNRATNLSPEGALQLKESINRYFTPEADPFKYYTTPTGAMLGVNVETGKTIELGHKPGEGPPSAAEVSAKLRSADKEKDRSYKLKRERRDALAEIAALKAEYIEGDTEGKIAEAEARLKLIEEELGEVPGRVLKYDPETGEIR